MRQRQKDQFSLTDDAFWFGENDTYVNYSGSITSAGQ